MGNAKPLVIIESHIPYIRGVFENAGVDALYLAPEQFTARAVRSADALIVRTRTRINRELLEGSAVKIVATATIGTDHIDLDWCAGAGIAVANAPGCNAPAVAQYVMASVASLINRPISQYTLGVVGVGNVGSLVTRWARALDMQVLLCDPVRQHAVSQGLEQPAHLAMPLTGEQWASMDEIARRCNIITFHTPLTASGPHPTHHLLDLDMVNSLQRAPIVINSARGAVCSTQALLHGLDTGKIHHAVIDCWEHEPNISPALLERAAIATPHIAGYSAPGKVRATQAALDAVCRHLGLPPLKALAPEPPQVPMSVSVRSLLQTYNPFDDTRALCSNPAAFENLRNNYTLRPETPGAIID